MRTIFAFSPAAATAALIAPGVLAMAILALVGLAHPLAAALAAAVVAAAVAGMALRPLRDAATLLGMIRGLGDGSSELPAMRTARGDSIATHLAHVRREWRTRLAHQDEQLAAYAATWESMPDPLFLIDGHNRVLRANAAARQMLQRDPTGSDVGAVLRSPALLESAAAARSGAEPADVEFVQPLVDASVFRARLRSLRGAGLDGAVLVVALHDVTAVRRASQLRADFVANASHELRTPLAALLGYIETLEGPARDDASAREAFLPIMRQMAARMGRLVEDLLSLSHIEFEEHERPTQPVALAELLRSVAEAFRPLAEDRGMPLHLDIADDLPVVPGQADQLAQVFQNLVDNALKYGREGTPVVMTARHAEGKVSISVIDQGDGIAREHLSRLTERFFRCDSARSRELGGTGLGLAIVKHIVARHRGSLLIDSTIGVGSVFTVSLPVDA